MKSLGNFPDPFIAEISGQPDAIRRAADSLSDQLTALERSAAVAREGTIVFTGMGSSYDACYPAVAALAGAGVPALHIDSSELLHFRRNLLPRAGLLVLQPSDRANGCYARVEVLSRNGDFGPSIQPQTCERGF